MLNELEKNMSRQRGTDNFSSKLGCHKLPEISEESRLMCGNPAVNEDVK